MDRSIKNAQEMHFLHPSTFDAPSYAELQKIKVGNYAKISVGRERFWTQITEIDGDKLKGKIANDLVLTEEHGYKCDDMIEFKLENIYQITNE